MTSHRLELAKHKLDLLVDVLSYWRGRYDDDGQPATKDWILAIVPFVGPKLWGCLYVKDSAIIQGIAWRFAGNPPVFQVRSRCGSINDRWPITRGEFRKAALNSGVTLPSIHATLFLTLPEVPA